jgi:hypothetical protein
MAGKIRVGFIVNKGHDPILVGQQDRDWPEKFKIKNNTGPNAAGWGGQFHIDVAVGLKVGRLHPDIFHIDLILAKELTLARLQKNHLNFNLGHDYIDAHTWGPKHAAIVKKALEPKSNNLYPEWPVQNWIYRKDIYLKELEKSKIPIIPTISVIGKFKAKDVLNKVKAKGWDKFFIKPGDFGAYGGGTWHGRVADCVNDLSSLEKYEKEDAPKYNVFLVQPYMLKANGNVFDEIRHYFVDGKYRYAVYTDGTADDDVWTQPQGKVLEATKELAHRAYARWLKVTKWRGKPFVPPLCRVDIGMIPDKKCKGGVRTFVNEIEQECTTFLVRYCPFNLLNLLGTVYVRKARELLHGRCNTGEKVANKDRVKELLDKLDERLKKDETKKRKREDEHAGLSKKKRA